MGIFLIYNHNAAPPCSPSLMSEMIDCEQRLGATSDFGEALIIENEVSGVCAV
jgi:hypothetical protein